MRKIDRKMDVKRLIAEIFEKPVLWNESHLFYNNREVANIAWMDISTIFKLPGKYLY